MSIEIKQNGKKALMPIWSTEIGLVDFNKNFKGKNVDEALKELKEDKTNILKTIDKSMTRKDNQLIENGDLIQLLPSLKLDKLYTVTNNVTNIPNNEWFNMVLIGQDANSITVELIGLWSNRKWYLNRNTSGNSGWKELATTEKPQEFQITGQNGFNAVGGSKATYFKTQDGVVNINAYLCSQKPINADNLIIFNLPNGYRPDNVIRVLAKLNSGLPDTSLTEMLVYSNGEAKLSGTNIYTICFSISFLGVN